MEPSQYFPIENDQDFHDVCQRNREAINRVLNYVIQDLDRGWRDLSRRESDILRHKLKFLEELQETINSAASGPITLGLRG